MSKGEYIIIASVHVCLVYTDWLERLVQLLYDDTTGLVMEILIASFMTHYK